MNEQQVAGLVELALEPHTLLTAGGIFLLLRMIAATPVGSWNAYRRILPILPDVLGVAAAFLGGIPVVEDGGVALKVAAGLWCGYLSQRGHKILGQAILGDDSKITPKPIATPKEVEPEEEEAA